MPRKEDGSSFGSIDELMALLSSPDHFERAEAARQLCNMGTTAIKALPAILALHNDPWYQVRIQVPRAIIHMEARHDVAAQPLSGLLDDEDETVKLYAKKARLFLEERKRDHA